ncbi:hypothetical protein NDU88_003234 [Pleurodeles waltl]|uniref:Uncharacterized protein n=1 Tax=Pleurodeles waltl TaxID=8319 RepID=A0AAV7MZK4_PLEWA|nr:hypothetical protein NDU88_003234 [Pleurodeles waltl]
MCLAAREDTEPEVAVARRVRTRTGGSPGGPYCIEYWETGARPVTAVVDALALVVLLRRLNCGGKPSGQSQAQIHGPTIYAVLSGQTEGHLGVGESSSMENWRTRTAMSVSNGRGTEGTSETAVRQSPERIENGRVEIQADGNKALPSLGQCGDAKAPSLMREKMAIQEEPGA